MNPKVFVSHASEDKERFVLSFATKLRENGIDAWVDRWEMYPGDSLVDKIFEEGVGGAQAFIVVLSQYSVVKRWVREELNAAVVKRIEKGTKIIPIVLDNCDVPESLKSTLWVKIADLNDYATELNRIVSSIYEHRDKPPLGTPPAYTQTALDKLPGLTKIDSIVLRLAGEKAIENEHSLVITDEVLNQIKALSISRQDFLDSLEVLDGEHYLELHRVFGGQIPDFSITSYGFEQYAKAFISGYDVIIKDVLSRIVNHDEMDDGTIASSLNQPVKLISHILDMLAMRGYLKTIKEGDGTSIYNVSPQLKRLLEKA